MTSQDGLQIGTERSAYDHGPQHSDALLTEVGRGSPCGELMRRYWQPVLSSKNVTARPQQVRILGEDLIAFRDKSGRPGLLYPHCMHRGTSLFWGRVEEDGIRCCYHGWKFDVEGHCLDQPCEPLGGIAKANVRQPWYPVREHYGLLWAYMGPINRIPTLPRFDCMEPLADDEEYWISDNSLSAHTDPNGPAILPYSWLHMNDNAMDPFHVQVLHATFSVTQFVPEFAIMPKVKFGELPYGTTVSSSRELADGRTVDMIVTWVAPNIFSVPSLVMTPGHSDRLTIIVPVDDTHCRTLITYRMKKGLTGVMAGTAFENFKPWSEMSIEERQDAPGDYEAQSGQGPVALHSEEHLVTSDRGIGLQRRILKREIERVAHGHDPVGLDFSHPGSLVHIPSGHFFKDGDVAVAGVDN